jgi:hypothetical protein
MKRYQCIKNYYMENGDLAFIAGRVYQSTTDKAPFRFKSEGMTGHYHAMYDEHMGHFQELIDLHVDDIPRDEAYPEPFTTPEPRRKLTAGWAWFIVLMTTLTAIILSEIL